MLLCQAVSQQRQILAGGCVLPRNFLANACPAAILRYSGKRCVFGRFSKPGSRRARGYCTLDSQLARDLRCDCEVFKSYPCVGYVGDYMRLC